MEDISHMWYCKFKLFELMKFKIQVHSHTQPHCNSATATRGLWLPYWIGQIQNISLSQKDPLESNELIFIWIFWLLSFLYSIPSDLINNWQKRLKCFFSTKERAILNMSVIYSFLTTYEIYSFSEWRGPGVWTFDSIMVLSRQAEGSLVEGCSTFVGLRTTVKILV